MFQYHEPSQSEKAMKIDNLPAIRAFVEARRDEYQCGRTMPQQGTNPTAAVVSELELILRVCNGLQMQMDLLSKVTGL